MHQGQGNQMVLLPEYLSQFRCTGPECEDNCCLLGWNVCISKSAYKKYRLLADKDRIFKRVFSESMVLSDSGGSGDFARVKPDQDGKCSFLTEDGHCYIHKQYGESSLSEVCANYPRIMYRFNSSFLCLGTFSCPEMARLGLFNRAGIKLCQSAMKEIMPRYLLSKFFNIDESWYFDTFGLAIEILQERSLTVEERLLLLGLAAQMLDNAPKSEHPSVCQQVRRILYSTFISEEISRVKSNTDMQIRLVKEIADLRFASHVDSKKYINNFKKTLISFRFEDGADLRTPVEEYTKVLSGLREDLKKYSYIFENYLVYSIMTESFGLDSRIFDGYTKLVVKFALVRTLLAGVAWHDKGLTEDTFLDVIQPFSKVVEHDLCYLDQVFNLLKKNSMDTLPYMAILLKI